MAAQGGVFTGVCRGVGRKSMSPAPFPQEDWVPCLREPRGCTEPDRRGHPQTRSTQHQCYFALNMLSLVNMDAR